MREVVCLIRPSYPIIPWHPRNCPDCYLDIASYILYVPSLIDASRPCFLFNEEWMILWSTSRKVNFAWILLRLFVFIWWTASQHILCGLTVSDIFPSFPSCVLMLGQKVSREDWSLNAKRRLLPLRFQVRVFGINVPSQPFSRNYWFCSQAVLGYLQAALTIRAHSVWVNLWFRVQTRHTPHVTTDECADYITKLTLQPLALFESHESLILFNMKNLGQCKV